MLSACRVLRTHGQAHALQGCSFSVRLLLLAGKKVSGSPACTHQHVIVPVLCPAAQLQISSQSLNCMSTADGRPTKLQGGTCAAGSCSKATVLLGGSPVKVEPGAIEEDCLEGVPLEQRLRRCTCPVCCQAAAQAQCQHLLLTSTEAVNINRDWSELLIMSSSYAWKRCCLTERRQGTSCHQRLTTPRKKPILSLIRTSCGFSFLDASCLTRSASAGLRRVAAAVLLAASSAAPSREAACM